MVRKCLISTVLAGMLAAAATVQAAGPGTPNFTPRIYGDGEPWGTKGTTALPIPNDHNLQSFDKLYIFIGKDVAVGQLPVSEAAPRNPDYSGGRWYTHTAQWNIPNPPLVKSFAEIEYYVDTGELTVMPGSPGGGAPMFFQCPLLVVMDG